MQHPYRHADNRVATELVSSLCAHQQVLISNPTAAYEAASLPGPTAREGPADVVANSFQEPAESSR